MKNEIDLLFESLVRNIPKFFNNADNVWFRVKERVIDSFINFGGNIKSIYTDCPEWSWFITMIIGLIIIYNLIRRVK
jgi:hypothetical protein